LTAISRVFGFARDMMLARLLGAGLAADAFQLAFVLPNTFRRLFAEGAFSVAFVPMYAKVLQGEGEAAATRFAEQVLAIFVWVLLAASALAMMAMPGIVWLLADGFAAVPGKFALAVTLSRITFPYLALISLVAMLSGLLNARARFGPGAIAPLLLNLTLIAAMGAGWLMRSHLGESGDVSIAYALAIGVALAGAAQLGFMAWSVRRAGLRLRLQAPRLSPEVRRLAWRILPATAGASIYQASQFVDTFFATALPQGSLTLLRYADRLIQLPLGVVGIALGTAILPLLARAVHAGEEAEAGRVQAGAVELALLLTLPAATALAICAPAFVTALFVGGRFTAADGAVMAQVVAALVCGLPAYVLVKVFQPGFFSRDDTRTPMLVASLALLANIALNLVLAPRFGIVGLAAATAACATFNGVALGVLLTRRGWFRFEAALLARIVRQAIASAVMGAALWAVLPLLARYVAGDVLGRMLALSGLLGAGLAVFLVAALLTGALDKRAIAALTRRAPAPPPAD
jgi:putative peptidoglycan lipid II flippase